VSSPSQAKTFAQYNRWLLALVSTLSDGLELDPDLLASSLDGESAEQLRRLVPLTYRRQVGAFFTSGTHRKAVASALADLPVGPYLDPTCGAGDLLLAASRLLPVGPDLASTLDLWAAQLSGWDIHPEFVKAAKLRLALAAAGRSPRPSSEMPARFEGHRMPRIKTADATVQLQRGRLTGTVILLNPPFGSTIAPDRCPWAEGLTSRAAIFVERVLDAAGSGCHIVAILPDVLRTGSRYDRWRKMIELRSRILSIKPLGLFDEYTDVDVFLLVAKLVNDSSNSSQKIAENTTWWNHFYGSHNSQTVGDLFSVMVGPVVDNRDPHDGPEHSFAIARDLPQRGIVGLPTRTRQFNGRLFTPPFVLLRRTSRPTSKGEVRAAGVLVEGNRMVAVDNHLLVAKPFDDSISTCERLLVVLEDPRSTGFLNQRIRCRHLTVGSVRELPWTVC
jgi:hypothetical protein